MNHRQLATDFVESVTRIALPFPVEIQIANKINIRFSDSLVRAVYLDMKGVVEKYSVAKDCDKIVRY